MTDRPDNPLDAEKARKAAHFRKALLTDQDALNASRRLARLVTQGYRFDDPEVVTVADRLRDHVEQLR